MRLSDNPRRPISVRELAGLTRRDSAPSLISLAARSNSSSGRSASRITAHPMPISNTSTPPTASASTRIRRLRVSSVSSSATAAMIVPPEASATATTRKRYLDPRVELTVNSRGESLGWVSVSDRGSAGRGVAAPRRWP